MTSGSAEKRDAAPACQTVSGTVSSPQDTAPQTRQSPSTRRQRPARPAAKFWLVKVVAAYPKAVMKKYPKSTVLKSCCKTLLRAMGSANAMSRPSSG